MIRDLQEQRRLADARWHLLQTIVEGLRCVEPRRYGTDCGECIVCRCRYREGALVGYEDAALRSVPGSFQMRDEHRAAWDGLDKARESKRR